MIAGSPYPLGASTQRDGTNFAVFSSHATGMELVLLDERGLEPVERHRLPGRTGDVWHGLLPGGVRPGRLYAYRADGPCEPAAGHRFDPQALLLDPYARAVGGEAPLPRAQLIDASFDWQEDRLPGTPWRDTVIYELHVKGYTRRHPGVPESWRGTYLGLTAPAVLKHLSRLGITAVELLPCQAFLTEGFLRERGLTNYWGYNPLAWFAPAPQYAIADAVREFKTMVRALHGAGIEVILDVVFNHTAEGNETGPVLSLKGLDNAAYYRLMQDRRHYENASGCGNTVNCAHPAVRRLIVDCLRYWVEEMHVDGFRFDLASVLGREEGGFDEHAQLFRALRAESALTYTKLIAEPWDVGFDGYQLGRFPPGWSEWNDRYRDAARAFWRGDPGTLGEFAERLAGSSDIFRYRGRRPQSSINFVTAHDGFTLEDLVSYEERHNEANLENNADGHRHNLSANYGTEGPSEDPAIRTVRARQKRNLLLTVLLSQGVPMLLAGDELGHTQLGNNNAYCQDNAISWLDWDRSTERDALIDWVRELVRVRRTYPELRRETFLKGTASRSGAKDVTWLHPQGREMSIEDWRDPALRCLGVWYGKRGGAGRLLLLLNAGLGAESFSLPAPVEGAWRVRLDSSLDRSTALEASSCRMQARHAVLLEC